MNESKSIDVTLCTSCILVNANREDESLTDDDPEPLALLGDYAIIAERPCEHASRIDGEYVCDGCREGYFSSRTCDGCGQALAGDRFDYVAILR